MPFQYQPRSAEQWEKRSKGSLYEGFALDEYTTFTAKKENHIRILPPTWDKPTHYGMDLYVHFSVGPNNGTVVCLYKMHMGQCPICEAQSRAEANGHEKEAKEFKATRRVLAWVLDRKEEKTPLLWAMPWTIDRDISKICRDRSSGELYQIDHPDSGYDVFFDKEGDGMTTKYTGFSLSRKPSSVDQKHIDYIMAHPVPTTLYLRTYEEVQSLFEGQPPIDTKPEATTAPQSSTAAMTPPPVVSQTAPPAMPPSPPPVAVAAPPPPPPVFVSAWTGGNCSVCGQGQFTTPTGVNCVSGHENASPQISVAGNGAAPPVAQVTEMPSKAGGKAAAMREKFLTGQGK